MRSTQARTAQHGNVRNTLSHYLEKYKHEGIASCIKRWFLQGPLTEERIGALERHKELIKKVIGMDGELHKAVQDLRDLRDRRFWCWWR